MNFYAFHIGDYASATRHLSWVEDAAYRRLLDVYYTREAPLPLELRQVYRLVIASTDEQREAVDTILAEFFTLADDGWRHSRCDAEISRAQEKRLKAAQSANARWSNAHSTADALPTDYGRNANASDEACERIESDCEGNAPIPTPTPSKQHIREPSGFAEFWSAYPKKVGKAEARKAFSKAKINGHLPDVLKAISEQAASEQWRKEGGQFIPNPATWIRQGRWEDESISTAPRVRQLAI